MIERKEYFNELKSFKDKRGAYSVIDNSVLDRELKPLESISDHNPKYLLTMDNEPLTSHNGIK